jgi:hypothetical protein
VTVPSVAVDIAPIVVVVSSAIIAKSESCVLKVLAMVITIEHLDFNGLASGHDSATQLSIVLELRQFRQGGDTLFPTLRRHTPYYGSRHGHI